MNDTLFSMLAGLGGMFDKGTSDLFLFCLTFEDWFSAIWCHHYPLPPQFSPPLSAREGVEHHRIQTVYPLAVPISQPHPLPIPIEQTYCSLRRASIRPPNPSRNLHPFR